MFAGCENIININFKSFETKNIINIDSMFSFCETLNNLPDIFKWNIQNVINMSNMFSFCDH